jgi:hypothetical protein
MIRPRPVYESLCTISWSFDQILQELESLQLLDGFRGQSPLKSLRWR